MCTQPVLNYIFGTEHLCLRIPVVQYKQTIWRQHTNEILLLAVSHNLLMGEIIMKHGFS